MATKGRAMIPDAPAPEAQAQGRTNRVMGLLVRREVVLTVGALLLVMYFENASSVGFLTSSNISLLLRQLGVVAVCSAGVAMLIIMGEIDLSIGSAAFFTGLIAAQCQVHGWGLWGSVAAAVAVGAAIGLAQGIVIAYLAVPAFIVTLGGLLLWRGLGLTWTNSLAVGPVNQDFINLTDASLAKPVVIFLAALVLAVGAMQAYAAMSARGPGDARWSRGVAVRLGAAAVVSAVIVILGLSSAGLPTAVLWIAVVAGILGFALARGKFGRRVFLLGSNREAAVYAGINAKRTVLVGFVLMGAIYGVAGVMTTAHVGVSTPDASTGLELNAIAAAVIGGNSLRGGVGSISGAIVGALLLATINNGMALLSVSTYAQNVFDAAILILAVGVDGFFRRRYIAR